MNYNKSLQNRIGTLETEVKELKLILSGVVGRSEQLCQYEQDNTTAMNCKNCGRGKYMH
jgi:hypothetical protein